MVAGGLGIEPKLTASKAAVLPLDDPPIFQTFYTLLGFKGCCPRHKETLPLLLLVGKEL